MSFFHIITDSLLFGYSSNIFRWVACARGEFSCDQCGKTFPVGAKLRDHIKDYHEVSWTSIGTFIAHKLNRIYNNFQSEDDKSHSEHKVVHQSVEIKKEVATFAEATSITEVAEHYNIEKSTISGVVPKKNYFQQKYSEEVIITTNLQIINLELIQLYRLCNLS